MFLDVYLVSKGGIRCLLLWYAVKLTILKLFLGMAQKGLWTGFLTPQTIFFLTCGIPCIFYPILLFMKFGIIDCLFSLLNGIGLIFTGYFSVTFLLKWFLFVLLYSCLNCCMICCQRNKIILSYLILSLSTELQQLREHHICSLV